MSFKDGKKTEYAFTEYLENLEEVDFTKEATKSQDMKEHWDLEVTFKDKTSHKYDVKGIRKVQRYSTKDDTIHWVELKNVAGNKGWIDGKASHIVFETFTEWIVITPFQIKELLREKIPYPIEYVQKAKDALYKLYTRKDRKDLITMVLTEDLRKKAYKIYIK
jgi:hypothetical protein